MGLSDPVVFWTKIVFIVVCFCEGFFAGIFPTVSAGCRENPKILGIANAFACGVFLAIALIHILPEEAEEWTNEHPDADNLFPLPYFLMFIGYTLILFVDKVAFDSSALTGGDPAMRKLSVDIAQGIRRAETTGENPDEAVNQAVQDYNDPTSKFSTRMKATLDD